MVINFFRCSGIVVTILLLMPSLGFAVGNIHVGGLEIHPYVSASYRYDDNIFMENGNEVGDGIAIISPGVNFNNRGEVAKFSLGINLGIYQYSENTNENRIHTSGTISIGNEFPGGFSMHVSGTYTQTEDPATSEQTDLQKRTQNDLNVKVGQKLYDRLSFFITYDDTKHDYKDLKNQNRHNRQISGELDLRLLPKTSFFFGYGVKQINYDRIYNNPITGAPDNRNSDTLSYLFGIRGQVTGKVSLNLKMGYETRDYVQTTKEDFSSFVTMLQYIHNISNFTKLTISGTRKNTESFYSDTTAGNVYNYYEENSLVVNVNYRISHKISGSVSGSYGINDYKNKSSIGDSRKDDLIGFGFGLNYGFSDWLNVGASYHYKVRDSTIDAEDYENNQFTLTLKASF